LNAFAFDPSRVCGGSLCNRREFPPPTGAIFDVVCEFGEEAKAA